MDLQQWQRIKETFSQVVEQPTERRAELLQELCADDVELRREVESLLDAHDETEQLIRPDAFGIGARLRAEVVDYAGRHFGPYRIVREIGRGGMGAVFLAERADGEFHRQVALKIVRRSLVDQDLERRFRRERQILATLSHPHIAHLLDGGVSADGEPFFVMEYVEGVRIDEYCARTKLTTRERLKLFLNVCRAVAYAHEQLVIHRDLKPSNILVTREGVPKLLDFGIAKLLDLGGSGDQTATECRAFTPDYAAPEQVRGEQQLTPATDVFSLGVLLSVLFDGSAPAKTSGAPTPAPAGGAARVGAGVARDTTRNASLNREVQNIIAMARRDEPERRYQSARELSQDIERHLDGLPVVAQPDTVRYRAVKFIERRRVFLTASVLVVGALVAGIAVATFYATLRDRRADATTLRVTGDGSADAPARGANPLVNVRTIAVLPLKSFAGALQGPAAAQGGRQADDQSLRVGMADSLVTKLSQVRQLTVRPTSATVRYLDQAYDVVAVGRELQVDSVLEGTLQRAGDELRTNLQLVDVASGNVVWAESLTSDLADVLRGQESLANRVSQLLALNVSGAASGSARTPHGSANLAAQDAFLRGSLALATSVRQVSNIFAARDAFEQAIRLDPDFALALAGLANAYTLAGSLTLLAPQDSYPKAERAARRALVLDPGLATAYVALAEIEADYNWNWRAADANNRRALELAPNNAAAHHSYAEFLARQRTLRRGRRAFRPGAAAGSDPHQLCRRPRAALLLRAPLRRRHRPGREGDREGPGHVPRVPLSLGLARGARRVCRGPRGGPRAGALTGGAVPDVFVLGCNYALMNDRANAEGVVRAAPHDEPRSLRRPVSLRRHLRLSRRHGARVRVPGAILRRAVVLDDDPEGAPRRRLAARRRALRRDDAPDASRLTRSPDLAGVSSCWRFEP